MTFGSLFSGFGGLDLGLERAGMECRWQVEINEYCNRVLSARWSSVRRLRDVHDVSSGTLEAVDLICGGFPCQSVSNAGKRKAQADHRWLWPEYARVVAELRPRLVLLENVPGLLTLGGSDVAADLATLGYDAEWDIVPAEAVGAWHKRERWFCIANARCEGQGRSGQPGTHRTQARTGARDAKPDLNSQSSSNVEIERGRGLSIRPGEPRQATPYANGSFEAPDALQGGCGQSDGSEQSRDCESLGLASNSDRNGLRTEQITKCERCGTPKPSSDSGYSQGQRRCEGRAESEAWQRHDAASGATGNTHVTGPQEYASVFDNAREELAAIKRTNRSGNGIWARCPIPGMGRDLHGLPPALVEPRTIPDRRHRISGLGNAVVPQVAEWLGQRIIDLHG